MKAVPTAADPATGEVHEVKTLDRNNRWQMVCEPHHLRIAPGDTVPFLPAHDHEGGKMRGDEALLIAAGEEAKEDQDISRIAATIEGAVPGQGALVVRVI